MSDETQTPPSDDLSWLALRYIGGEMIEAETVAFEERLCSDEAACEAVAVAVQASFAVRAAFDSETPGGTFSPSTETQAVSVQNVTTRKPARSARWLSLAVSALALLLVLSVANFQVPETSSSDADRDRELAVLWTEAGLATEPDEMELPAIVENENEEASAELGEDRLSPVDLVAGVPEWMLVALESQGVEAGDDDEILEN